MVKESIRFSTFNCRGLAQTTKRRTVFQWLKKYYNGFIFLQETHSTEIAEKQWRTEWKGQVEFSHGLSTARGVAIMLPNNIDYTVNDTVRDGDGRFLLLDCNVDGHNLILVNIYAPTKDKKGMQEDVLIH